MTKSAAKKVLMSIDAYGEITFGSNPTRFATDKSPQILRIDTSQLYQRYPDASIVALKIDPAHEKHVLATYVEDTTRPWMREVSFNQPLQGRIDGILILFDMPTDPTKKTPPFPFYLRIARTLAGARSEEDYDPQVGNDPPVV